MKKIQLTQGKFALVDDGDFEWLNQWKWTLSGDGYAYRGIYENGKRVSSLKMHHLIAGKPTEGLVTDHINRHKLDNRRSNLRHVTKSKNGFNSNISKRNTSGHKGVVWDKSKDKWQAQIFVNGKYFMLGRFDNLEEAVSARKSAEQRIVCA